MRPSLSAWVQEDGLSSSRTEWAWSGPVRPCASASVLHVVGVFTRRLRKNVFLSQVSAVARTLPRDEDLRSELSLGYGDSPPEGSLGLEAFPKGGGFANDWNYLPSIVSSGCRVELPG